MKRILLFLITFVCVQVGAWATITITSETVYIGGGQYTGGTPYSGYGIYGAQEGELAQLLNGTYTGTVQWNGASLSDLTSAEYIKVGSTSTPNVLNDADLAAIELLSGAKYLDIDGSTLAAGANIASIKAGDAIEAVTLPDGLSKADVNAAGAALTACNANFGSCLSLDAEMVETQVTTYTYEDPCTSEKVDYNGEVTDGQGYVENITRPLTLTSSSVTYVNSKFRNEVTPVSNVVENGYVVPNPLKVELTKLDTPKTIYQIDYNGQTLTVPSYAVNTSTNPPTVSQEFNCAETNWQNTEGLTGKPLTVVTVEYTYTMRDWQAENPKDYFGTPQGDETNGYYAMVENVYSDQYGYRFEVTSSYNYTYTDPTDNCKEVIVSYTDGPHETIDIPYNQTVPLEATTITVNVPKEGGDCDVIAYVNTPGSLYKAVGLDINDIASATGLVISGNINNGDISQGGDQGNSNDPQYNKNDDDKYEPNGAKSAFYINNAPAPIKSVDLSDAVIDDYKHLRALSAYVTKLESVVFPKTLTKIPNYCCYSAGKNSGCCNLSNVVFPTEATTLTIGDYAFQYTAIKNLILPSSVTEVGANAFALCPNLYSVEMEGLKGECTFGNYVFNQCPALQHVSLSEGVQNIGDYMFNQCVILESIRIPSTCKTIGERAFQFCYDIHQITIPEGVELIKLYAFEGAGLTDIYVMASTPAKVPKIYAMEPNESGNGGPSTFSYQRTTGNQTVPQNHRDDIANAEYDEVMSWYQEEQSGSEGLGSGNCLTALHYPESMKPFYEAIDVSEFYKNGELDDVVNWKTKDEYLQLLNSERVDYVTAELNNVRIDGTGPAYNFGTDEEGNPILYQYLPQTYAVNSFPVGHHNDDPMGPDKNGMYYPNQHDYWIRMVAGATGSQSGGAENVASQWGWRQFPLSSSIESIGEIPFEKEYDDTWYTMAFPWRMIDNQLFAAFNQKMEIVEFVGAEVLDVDNSSTENVKEYSLVFHFEDVAKTYYMDQEDNFYKRELETIREIQSGDVTINKKFYKYTLLDGKDGNETSTVITDPYPYDAGSASEAQREMHVKYLSIENIMVLAGHPYMIHPSIGASPGNPVKVYINGVKKIKPGEGLYEDYEDLAAVAEANKVSKTVSSRTRTREYGEDGTVTDTYSGPTEWKNPETNAGGKYYFIGNINDEVKTVDETSGEETSNDHGVQDMPLPCYFLGVPEGQYYPKYYKKTKGGVGKWSQYSAIIVPDDDAKANVEGLNGMTVTSSSGTGLAKGANIEIGAWDFNEMEIVDDISPIIDEALEKDKSAQIVHMNVVYNINGQIVRPDSGSLEGLPKGIYIVNGKKYMIK